MSACTSATALVLNAGSSSIKLAVFDEDGQPGITASASEIGGASVLKIGEERQDIALPDHREALDALLEGLAGAGVALSDIGVAGHRVVHGGARLTESRRITASLRDEIAALSPLAPLHNPHAVVAMDLLTVRAPDLPQVAVFDTAFHASNPEVARRYALPDTPETEGLCRYGFHGISYAGLVEALPGLCAPPLPRRLLACHLGNGASLCAILEGRSVATTMGYSPLDGLTMGTRAGTIDGNAVLELARRTSLERAGAILNNESGLLGLGGASDMRALGQAGTPEARFAIEHFAYWALRQAGSMIAAMGGLDAIAFTGGIGENDAAMRRSLMDGLAFTGLIAGDARGPALHAEGSPITAWIVEAAEEATIAREARRLIDA
ncbi:MAG: acetate kinase [Pseudomonadota bacterium]